MKTPEKQEEAAISALSPSSISIRQIRVFHIDRFEKQPLLRKSQIFNSFKLIFVYR